MSTRLKTQASGTPAASSSTEAFRQAVQWHQQGELQRAEAAYAALLRREPQHLQASYLLGLLATQTDRPGLAIELIGRYLESAPTDSQAMAILGLAHYDLKEYATAAGCFEQSLTRRPGDLATLNNLGKSRLMLAEHASALDAYERALACAPQDIDALTGKGLCERELGMHERALGTLENAIVCEPRRAESHFFYANVLRDARDLHAAIDAYGTAITLKPDYLEAYVNCASTLKDLGMPLEALTFYESALMLDPDHPEANYNYSLALLAELRLDEGWRRFERRLDSETSIRKFIGGQRIRVAPDWNGDGTPAALLVIGEQGLGDQIFFSGMLADLADRVPGATVCVEPRLVPLLARSLPSLRFIGPAEIGRQACDAQIQLGSLGRLFRPDTAALSRVRHAYLRADASRTAGLRSNIKREGRLVCGLSWLSKNADHGEGKSLDFASLMPVLGLGDIDFIDLQYGDTSAERAELAAQHGICVRRLDTIDNQNDIDGLAALISACDIVLTVSNTTAHLAAALGKPVIVMLPGADALFWYWHRDGHTTPWYPCARLLRKSDSGRWDDVIDAAALILAGLA
jgi:tetratricopeptide (TPR) repeat protein